jgi:hypothetical protein
VSYGTRKAIAGVRAGERFAHEGCEEAIGRYDACQTAADVRAVLAWCKDRGGWFLRSDDDDRRMREAFDRARLRAAARRGRGDPEGGHERRSA